MGTETRNCPAASGAGTRQRVRSRVRTPAISELSETPRHTHVFHSLHSYWRKAAMSPISNNPPKKAREGSQIRPQQERYMNTRRKRHRRQAVRSFIGILLTTAILSAQDFPDVTQISLEDLMNVRVTSVSKREQKLGDAPAAVFVITQDDIRRSGARTIPEALRMAPGIEVARIDENKWAISARGFNGRFANKLLVLIDGRSVYTPLFSGVYWDVQDTLLEDIDRIEVIRGPGATLWGANAVNGVINITTKSAKETLGGLLSGGYGTEEQGFGSARYGGKLGEDAYYRGYVKYFNRDSSALPSGAQANDAWDMYRGGFRTDWEPSAQNLFTLQGDAYAGTENQTVTLFTPAFPFTQPDASKMRVSGGNVIGRWTHTFTPDSDLKLQIYYDRTDRAVD